MTKNLFKIIAVLILLNSYSCKETVEEKPEVLRPVKYEVVGTANALAARTFSGIAKAGDEIQLSFRTNGIITKYEVSTGDLVKKGDLIARLDNVQASLAYEQSVTAVNTAQSGMNTAKSSLDRVKSLYEKGSSSLSEYEQARNAYQSASDQYQSALRNKSIQQTQIEYGFIRAPKDGTIVQTFGAINETVSPGQVIAVLNAGNDINVSVGLPENIINKITMGMLAALSFSAIDGNTFQGTVIEISPVLDPNTVTYPVKIEINNLTDAVKSGMAASVLFELQQSEANNTLVIPLKSVGEDGEGNYVFLIESEDGETAIVKRQTIEIGPLTEAGFEVVSGLQAGDKIATAGLQSLLDGQKVRLQ